MKNALAISDKPLGKPLRSASTVRFLDPAPPASTGAAARPMARVPAPASPSELRPRRLRQGPSDVPEISRLVYRSGAVLAR